MLIYTRAVGQGPEGRKGMMMTDKTAKQIERMKAQTFGVEVEGNGITRQKAAKVAAEYFGTEAYYIGNGCYDVWGARDAQGRVWKFSKDGSIFGPDSRKCELITPILKYEDMEMFQELLRRLRKAGMVSTPEQGCGVHIHIGLKGLDGRDHDARTLRNLVNIMACHENQLVKAIGVDCSRLRQWCRVVDSTFLQRVNRRKPTTMSALAQIWYDDRDTAWHSSSHYDRSRYHMLNLHACFSKGTIEFRMFQFANPHDGKKGGIHAGEMKAYIQLCLAMSEMAKSVKCASARPQQTENEKYAMRCWMLRLGFIGEEFETARTVLLRNMEGNGAWRRVA